MSATTIGLLVVGSLALGYVCGRLKEANAQLLLLRAILDRAWQRFCRTGDPDDFEDFCEIKRHVAAICDPEELR